MFKAVFLVLSIMGYFQNLRTIKFYQTKTTPDVVNVQVVKKQSLTTPTYTKSPAVSDIERNPFLKKTTGVKKPVHEAATKVDTVNESGDQETASQVIEDFADADAFDDEMNIEEMDDNVDFDEPMVEDEPEPEKEDPKLDNRGFIEQKTVVSKDVVKGWRSGKAVQQTPTTDVVIDLSKFPLTQVELTNPETGDTSTEEVLKMFWFDAYEDAMKHPGMVWLFSKVWIESAKAFVSCCLNVKNIPRRIYLAKREVHCDHKTGEPLPGDKEVNTMDLYNEFNNKIAKRYKILEHKCRPVEKCYAFEDSSIPNVGQYLEVIYSSNYPALPSDLKGETFSKVFGTPQTALEMFLLEQKLKGPGWIYVKGAVPHTPPTSWCKLEALANDPNNVLPANIQEDAPPLVLLSLKTG